MRRFALDPGELGLTPASPDDLRGGDVERNVRIARDLLEGRKGPAYDIVALNAAAGLVVGGLAADFSSGLERAVESIDAGRAAAALDAMVSSSREEGA